MAVAPAPYLGESFTTTLDLLLIGICEELQISESRYQQADERYKAVNRFLESSRSPFYALKPKIYPQGSMRLGTTVHPIKGPHDLDFVLELAVSHEHVDPMKLLDSLYLYLKDSDIYGSMTSKKNRCVRVEYANEFYLDILIACQNLSAAGSCIKVPDSKLKCWKDSNPRGYADWFELKSRLYLAESGKVLAKAEPIPAQQTVTEKNPLQLGVQLLKRWRDLRYPDPDLAPISVVLTTLAANKYQGQGSVSEALRVILAGILTEISEADNRFDRVRVHNPSNVAEDLSERWDANPKAYAAFRQGMLELYGQWTSILNNKSDVKPALEKLFGETVKKVVHKQTVRLQEDRLKSKLGVGTSGLIGVASETRPRTPANTFYGEE
jgi:hypothetical protein